MFCSNGFSVRSVNNCRMNEESRPMCSDGAAYDVPAPAAAGTTRKRKRTRSPSTDTSSSSSSSSDRYKRRKRRRGGKSRGVSDNLLKQLLSDVNELKSQMAAQSRQDELGDDLVDPNVSGEMYECNELPSVNSVEPSVAPANFKVNLAINTKTKEPSIPNAPDGMLKQIEELQRFLHPDWSAIRYADVQKSYLFFPGFSNLEPNEEIKQYDGGSKFTANMEKTFASLSYALLQQREALQNEMNNFLLWVNQNETLSYSDIYSRVNDIFCKGEYCKAANDTMQIVCGHRAELIQQRREGILSSVKDPLHKAALRKVPPSSSNLFEAEKFSSMLDKAGGVRKVFWQKNKDRNSAPQYDPGTSSHTQVPKKAPNKPAIQQNGEYAGQSRSRYVNNSFRGKGKVTRDNITKGKGARAHSPSSRRDRRNQTNKRN